MNRCFAMQPHVQKIQKSIETPLAGLRAWLLHLAWETIQHEQSQDAAHDYDHLVRVLSVAEYIQNHEGGDLPIIWAGAAFHDLGREQERRNGGDHALISAEIASKLLVNTQFPQNSLAAVILAIQEHRLVRNRMPTTLESRILYDADKIDILGAVGIGRLFYLSGRYNQKLYALLPDSFHHPISLSEIHYLRASANHAANIEFQFLFEDLPERMMTPTGKKLAQTRYAYMADFFNRLEEEMCQFVDICVEQKALF